MTVVDYCLNPADFRRVCFAVPEPFVELLQRDLVAMLCPVSEILFLQSCEILLYITPSYLVERLFQRASGQA